MFEVTEFKPDAETDSRVNMFLADIFYKFALGVASRTQQLRGGALGAGAVALATGVSGLAIATPGAAPVILPGGAQAQYGNRTPTGAAAAANKRVAYVPENTNSRYNPARDPAVILQQQQMQQQHLMQQQNQGTVPGRTPYTPQQLQVQQQQMLQQQQQLLQNRASQGPQGFQQQAPQQRGGPHGPGASYAGAADQGPNRGAPQAQQQRGGAHTQSPNLGGMSYPVDDSFLASSDASGMQWLQPQQGQSHGGFQGNARQSGAFGTGDDNTAARPGTHGRPTPILTQTASTGTMGSGADGQFGQGQGQSFQRPPTGSSFLNPGAPTFHTDNNKWNSNFGNSASFGTPKSAQTAVPSFPSNEWLNTGVGAGDSGRFSALSSSSSGLTLHLPSMSSGSQQSGSAHLGAGLFSSGSLAPGGSFRMGGSLEMSHTYDDAMDKLIGVTNIGHIPSFDDPLDPQYQED
jgi:hypothetical protein